MSASNQIPPMWLRLIRIALGAIAFLMFYATLALFVQMPGVEEIWPWQGYSSQLSPLSFIFLSSIAASICAPLIWLAATGLLQAAAAGAIDLTIVFLGTTIYILVSRQSNLDNDRLLPAAFVMGVSAIINCSIFLYTRRLEVIDRRPLPKLIKYSFVLFGILLILVGTALVLVSPNVVPWDVTPEGSVIYGLIFLGASAYFVYALRNPFWENAVGPLLGFFAYDAILIVPFINRFSDVPDEQRLSLIIYTAVVTYSGLLSIYYLFINPETRFRKPQMLTTSQIEP